MPKYAVVGVFSNHVHDSCAERFVQGHNIAVTMMKAAIIVPTSVKLS